MAVAFQIPKTNFNPIPKRKAAKSKDYLSFLHSLPCIVTGQTIVQAAHVSFAAPKYGHYGRGKGTKASDRWALPLCEEQHSRQHNMNEQEYWLGVGIDPHQVALVIWGLFSEMGDDALPFAAAVIHSAREGGFAKTRSV